MANYERSEHLKNMAREVTRERKELDTGAANFCDIGFQTCDAKKKHNGKTVYADCTLVNDKLRSFAECDFVITFYGDALALPPDIQKRVMYHELLHVGYDAETDRRFVRPHDVEDFSA